MKDVEGSNYTYYWSDYNPTVAYTEKEYTRILNGEAVDIENYIRQQNESVKTKEAYVKKLDENLKALEAKQVNLQKEAAAHKKELDALLALLVN